MKTIFHNGTVYTGKGFCQSFAVEDGLFTAAGSNAEMLALQQQDDQLIDLQGRFVCAGFNDSHMHLLNLGQYLTNLRLDEHTGSLREMLEYARNVLNSQDFSNGRWLKGRGWNQDYFTDVSRMPDVSDLDQISTEIPIMLTRACGHCCVVNSRALELAGITADTVSPEGGAIGLTNGRPNGLFYDNAISLITAHIPSVNKDDIKKMILESCRLLNSYGITSSQSDDYGVFPDVSWETVNQAYRELAEEGKLTVRVYEQANFSSPEKLLDFMEKGDLTGKGDDMFRIGPLKMLGDGSLGGRTAHLSHPYADDGSTCGFSLFTDQQFEEMFDLANRNGMQIAVHAIGDECLDKVLNALKKALDRHPRDDHRHGIVHCQISQDDQLKRIAEMNLHVYAQSIFLDYDNHIVDARAGSQLARTSYSWKTLMNLGVTVSNGSDAPVELPDVMKGIQCAVTRTSLDGTGPYLPDQAFTVREAIDSFTIASAHASFDENRKGRIEKGFLADFVILSKDPFKVSPDALHQIRRVAVYLSGTRVMEA